MAKGILVKSETKKLNKPSVTHSFKICITEKFLVQLAPEARFSVSIVTADGELIYDSLAINVENYFLNKV